VSIAIAPALQAAILASQSPVVLEFLTIEHPELATPLYRVNNPTSIVKGGITYLPWGFKVDRPVDKDGELGDAALTIDVVDLSLIIAIRSVDTPVLVTIDIALADDPDATPELSLGKFEWRPITYTDLIMSGTLAYKDRLNVSVPALEITPVNVPGSF